MAKAKAVKATAEAQVTNTSEEKAPEAVLSFEDFLAKYPKLYNPGLIASFKFEENNGGKYLEPRTEKDWVIDLENQSNKTY